MLYKNEFLLIENQLLDKEKDIIKKKNILEKSEFEKQVNILKEEINEYTERCLIIKTAMASIKIAPASYNKF